VREGLPDNRGIVQRDEKEKAMIESLRRAGCLIIGASLTLSGLLAVPTSPGRRS